MKKIIFLILVIISASCTKKKSTPTEQITAYYQGFKKADYNQVKRTLADSLITTEGDFKMPFSKDSYHEKFKWDSVFKPEYKLISIENKNEHPVATISVRSKKFEFLRNNPVTIRNKFYFKSGKIAKIETMNFVDARFDLWEKEKVALVQWVKQNHPELDGFMNDLTMKGAQDYMKAIALYQNRKDSN